ncbi:hypothetical protein OQA88_12915 [Cercophora sp. LCS_1]
MSSNVSTPYLEPYTTTLPPTSPSPLATNPPLTALDDIPPLSLDVLTSHEDKVDALKLVADSVVQQRQQATSALVTHPLLLTTLSAALAGVYQYAWVQRNEDLGTALLLVCSVIMTFLLSIRYAASGYIKAAEDVNWDWLVNEDGEEDVIIGTRHGKDIVGACVVRLEPNPTLVGKKKNRSLKGGKGVIRAWTTKTKFRGKGVGGDMLKEVVRVTRERCGRDAAVGFAMEHANSVRVLPEMFNGAFRKSEMRAARTLEGVAGKKR